MSGAQKQQPSFANVKAPEEDKMPDVHDLSSKEIEAYFCDLSAQSIADWLEPLPPLDYCTAHHAHLLRCDGERSAAASAGDGRDCCGRGELSEFPGFRDPPFAQSVDS